MSKGRANGPIWDLGIFVEWELIWNHQHNHDSKQQSIMCLARKIKKAGIICTLTSRLKWTYDKWRTTRAPSWPCFTQTDLNVLLRSGAVPVRSLLFPPNYCSLFTREKDISTTPTWTCFGSQSLLLMTNTSKLLAFSQETVKKKLCPRNENKYCGGWVQLPNLQHVRHCIA